MNRSLKSLFGGLEEIIEAFEDARALDKSVRIRDFLPDRDAPVYIESLQELIRVELDHQFRNGVGASLDEYREEFPELFASPDLLVPLAFEEYRLRLQTTSPMDSAEFAERYGIDTSQWPKPVKAAADHSSGNLCAGVNADFQPGDRLLDFVIVGELGKGAFSKVYLARQLSLAGRLVVLKLSSIRLNEAERLAKLQHTNIVPVYSVHDHGRFSIICMPWFGSATLKEVIESVSADVAQKTGETFLSTVTACDSRTLTSFAISPQLSQPAVQRDIDLRSTAPSKSPLVGLDLEQATLWIGQRLAEGLNHAHSRGILHRDLKPANVLLTVDGQPMILDFNLATEQQDDSQTDAIVGGTLPYMSPEQIASIDSFRSLNATADVYSLGVILFELLTGRLPFKLNGGDRQKMIEERWSQYPGPRHANSRISVDTDSIIRKCLAADPSRRYSSAAELADDLRLQLSHQPLAHAVNRSARERAAKWVRRHPQVTSVSGIVTLSLIALAIVGGLWWKGYQNLQSSMAQQRFLELEKQLPSLQAEAFAAAIGEVPRAPVAELLQAAVLPFVSGIDGPHELQGIEKLSRLDQEAVRNAVSELQFMISELQSKPTAVPPAAPDSATARTESLSPSADSTDPETADDAENYRRAFELVMQSRFEDASRILTPLSNAHPNRFRVILSQGMLDIHSDRFEDAEIRLTAAIALQPDSVQAWYQRGVCRLGWKRYQGAAEDFSQVLKLDPSRLTALVSRAIANLRLGRSEIALRDLTQAINGGFPETRVYFLRAAVYRQLQNPDAARIDTEKGLSLEPRDALSWVARGLAWLPNKPETAISDFRQAQLLNPTSHEVFRNMSMVLSEYLHQPDEAIQVLNEAVVHHPQDAYLWAGRGVLHARAGRRAEAIHDAREALMHSDEPLLTYMVACIHALTSAQAPEDGDEALRQLANSVLSDASLAKLASTDQDLGPIVQRVEFQAILNAVEILNEPVAGQQIPKENAVNP